MSNDEGDGTDEKEASTPKISDPRRDPTLPPTHEIHPREGTKRSPAAVTQKLQPIGPEMLLAEEVRLALGKVTEKLEQGVKGLHEDVKGLHETIRQNANQSLDAHEQTRKHLDRLGVHVALNAEMTRTLWTDRFGERPPPKPPESGQVFMWLDGDKNAPRSAPKIPRPDAQVKKAARASSPEIDAVITEQDRKITDHDSTIYALKGQMIAMDGQLQELLTLQKKQMGIREEKGETFLRRFWDALSSRQTQKFVLLTIGAITSLVTACGTTYALMTGRLPMPSSHVEIRSSASTPPSAPKATTGATGSPVSPRDPSERRGTPE